MGCPHYVAIERKPENGMEIQDVACGVTHIMLGLKLVKSAKLNESNGDGDLTNGVRVLRELCLPWACRERHVFGDSYFASVSACEELFKIGLRFTGPVKTATSRYPTAFFNEIQLANKGEWQSLQSSIHINGSDRVVAAVCWRDRHRRQYVTTAGDIAKSIVSERIRWTQFKEGACPVDTGVRMPLAIARYHEVAGIIDRHNRVRQDVLDLEKIIGTHNWVFRLATTILGIAITDTRHLYNFGRSGRQRISQHVFFCRLGTELVDNDFDNAGIHPHIEDYSSLDTEDDENDVPEIGEAIQLVPSPPRAAGLSTDGDDRASTRRKQMRCASGCGMKTTWECDKCMTYGCRSYFCSPSTGRTCFGDHLRVRHNVG